MPEDLFNRLKYGPNDGNYWAAMAELECQKVEWQEELNKAQIEATKAATEAAKAAKATADYTKQNVQAMWWSVIGIWATAILSAFFQFLTWRGIH
jgi:ElaB/YqjD/DUF883 family membrane-anchored ribosome-binding protein